MLYPPDHKTFTFGGTWKDVHCICLHSNASPFVHSRGRKLSSPKLVWWEKHTWHLPLTAVDSWAAWGFHEQALMQLKFLILSHCGFKAMTYVKLFWILPSLLMWHSEILYAIKRWKQAFKLCFSDCCKSYLYRLDKEERLICSWAESSLCLSVFHLKKVVRRN